MLPRVPHSAGIIRCPQPQLAGLQESVDSWICHFWVAAWPRGQGYSEASLCCPRCAKPPSPLPLIATGREAEAYAWLLLPHQVLPRPQLWPQLPLCWGMAAVAGGMGGMRGMEFYTHTQTHVLTARWLHVGTAWQDAGSRCRPGVVTQGACVGWWAPMPSSECAGGFMGPVSAGKVLDLWLRTRRPGQDTSQSPPHGGQAQAGWTHFGALLASEAT